jgi:hypothetical protein
MMLPSLVLPALSQALEKENRSGKNDSVLIVHAEKQNEQADTGA